MTTARVSWWVKLLRACSRQCRNNLHIDSTYLQTYTKDNVQNTHTYTQYTQCTIRHTYSINTRYTQYVHTYIYIYAFSRRFYPKRLTSGYTFFCQYMCSLGIEPTTFALLTHHSTTEPQEHYTHTHIYTHNMWKCSRFYIGQIHSVMDVRCMVSRLKIDSCVCVVCV